MRLREQRLDARFLDDLAAVHHDHARRDLGDDAEVVRDHRDRRAEPLLQIREQLEDLRLDRDVECGRRLVGDDERRAHHERHRDQHALPHSARQLMRILTRALRRRGNADDRQHLDRAIPRRASRGARVHARDLGDLISDGEDRIERGHRLLEDHRDAIAANASDAGVVELQEILPLELIRLPGSMRPGCWMRRRIESAVTDFPQPDSPTMPSVSPAPIAERHAVDRAGDAGAGVEVGAEIGDGEERRAASSGRKLARVQRLAQAVRDEIHREHRDDERDAGEDRNPPADPT